MKVDKLKTLFIYSKIKNIPDWGVILGGIEKIKGEYSVKIIYISNNDDAVIIDKKDFSTYGEAKTKIEKFIGGINE